MLPAFDCSGASLLLWCSDLRLALVRSCADFVSQHFSLAGGRAGGVTLQSRRGWALGLQVGRSMGWGSIFSLESSLSCCPEASTDARRGGAPAPSKGRRACHAGLLGTAVAVHLCQAWLSCLHIDRQTPPALRADLQAADGKPLYLGVWSPSPLPLLPRRPCCRRDGGASTY